MLQTYLRAYKDEDREIEAGVTLQTQDLPSVCVILIDTHTGLRPEDASQSRPATVEY